MKIKNIVDVVFVNIPKEHRDDFSFYLIDSTFTKIYPLATLTILFETILFINALMQKKYIYAVFYSILIIIMIIAALANNLYNKGKIKNKLFLKSATPVALFIVLMWGAVVTLLDYSNGYFSPAVMIGLTYLLTVYLLTPPWFNFLACIVKDAFFLIASLMFFANEPNVINNIINVILNSSLAWLVSRAFYKSTYDRFVKDTLLIERNEELNGLNKRLEYISSRDFLTNLYNRRKFKDVVDKEWEVCLEHQIPIAFSILDVDHFKKFNDTFGHVEGDKCLIHIANIMKKFTKNGSNTVCRYGGEEFAVVMPGLNEKQAYEYISQLANEIKSNVLISDDGKHTYDLTVSGGVYADLPREDEVPENYINLSDMGLYQAKNSGRDKVVIYNEGI